MLPLTMVFIFNDCTLILFVRSPLHIVLAFLLKFNLFSFVWVSNLVQFVQSVSFMLVWRNVTLSLFDLLKMQWLLSEIAARSAVSTKLKVIRDRKHLIAVYLSKVFIKFELHIHRKISSIIICISFKSFFKLFGKLFNRSSFFLIFSVDMQRWYRTSFWSKSFKRNIFMKTYRIHRGQTAKKPI